jgi:hypothetical protein
VGSTDKKGGEGNSDEEDDGSNEDEDEVQDEDMAMDDEPSSKKSKSNSSSKPIEPNPSDEPLLTTAGASAGTPKSLLSLLTPPLIALSRPTPLSAPSPALPSVHPPTTSVLGGIHIRALECLNNLFVGMIPSENSTAGGGDAGEVDEEVMKGAVGVWNEMWSAELLGAVGEPVPTSTGGAAGGLTPEKRLEIWSVAIGVLWGLARMCKGMLVSCEARSFLFPGSMFSLSGSLEIFVGSLSGP